MAQTADMGPPMSPRETRRSGRRSALSASTSASKSPDSPTDDPAPTRPSLPLSNTGSSRSKKLKQEDIEGTLNGNDDSIATTRNNGVGNGRTKRRGKDKDKPQLEVHTDSVPTKTSRPPSINLDDTPEEELGITRCVCGSTDDDLDAGEFMVQCEACGAWQHGLCMGYEAEDQLPKGAYNCERCRPDQHQDLLKRLSKKGRHSSTTSVTAASRVSRSHSPSHLLKQPAKRRNTMNSRDANFDLMLQETLKATAAEAAAHDGTGSVTGNTSVNGREDLEEVGEAGIKKRKRMDDDAAFMKKRARSVSTTSDTLGFSLKDDPPIMNGTGTKTTTVSHRGGRNHKRGGGRKPAMTHEAAVSVDGDEVALVPISKRQSSGRGRGGPAAKRPPASQAGGVNTTHEHGTRRNHNSVAGGLNSSNTPSSTIAYRNSHAYAVSQQVLFTSWNLPDYLAHLEHMLPTDTPKPLEVLGSGLAADGEKSMERGVKVKWPSKRMSVGDMNKRVRALVEWVGREQAGASERRRRREALEKMLKVDENDDEVAVDGQVESTVMEKSAVGMQGQASTMELMEKLMEELIGFQERFGPGAKNRERERRLGAATSNS